MKTIKNILVKGILAAAILMAANVCAHATDVAYSGVFIGKEGNAATGANGSTVAKTYTRDYNTTGDRVSIQVVASTNSVVASKMFTDGSTSTGTITVSSNSFVQASTPTISISGINIVYTPQSTATNTALNIAAAINANSSLNTVIVATNTANVVYATSTFVGASANFNMTTSSQAALGVSGATMTGGTNSSYVINTPTITITSNNFVTGLQVLYTIGATNISGLTSGTTYFVSVINPNTLGVSSTFKLASSLANAQAGTGIVLASSATNTTADVFTLAPLAWANSTGGVQPQWSDDNVNWVNATTGNWAISVSSVTFVTGGNNTLWDFGPIQHRYLRMNVTPPTSGAMIYTITANERYSATH